ncbi:MAG: hypothetical protein OEM41_09435 [Ignavibacteria bacterium]|nr:hypothetical protein [Ignavibacteria bacterium]
MRIDGWLVLGALFTLFSWGCTDLFTGAGAGDSDEVVPLSGTYSYSGYDEKGTLIVTGHITIAVDDSSRITGTWQLKAATPEPPVGPMVGDGTLVGGIEGETIYMDLNPGWADNNVLLLGKRSGRRIIGKWEYVGFPGVIATGSFVAVRVDANSSLRLPLMSESE